LTGNRAGCLECHNSVSQRNTYAERWKDDYLLTGHKNMLRKVTPGKNWAGPDGQIYTGAASEQTIDFTAGTATGSYGTKTLMYIFGDWMAPAPDGLDTVVDMGGGVAKYNGTSTYSCAACHATGWSNAAAGVCNQSSKTTQTACESAGGTWYPSTGVQGTTGAEPLASFPSYTSGITGTWDLDGIQCTRCHAVTFPAVTGTSTHETPDILDGQNVTNICFGCHQGIPKTANGTGADNDLTFTGKIPVKNTATAPAYVPEYSGHVIGNQFLNSPHARFTGTITPNKLGKYDLTTNNKSQYASTFNGWICRSGTGGVGSGSILKTYVNPSTGAAEIIKTSADCSTAGGQWVASGGSSATVPTTQGSCTTCHDVHQSTVPEVGAKEPFVRECTTCHVDQVATYPGLRAITSFRHSAGTGTPLDEGARSCEICHMPKATSGGFPSHLFRISVDPAYSTFPTSAEFLGNTKKIANTAPDGTFTNAVWTDLDLACGQCHGGDAPSSGFPLTKKQLAMYAKGMHGTSPNARPVAQCSPTVAGRTVSFKDNSTDAGGVQSNLLINVHWGDWDVSTGPGGSTFTHTYEFGGTYTITHTAKDPEGATGFETHSVVIP
jgi:predicted CXXCH cytochrome family protein